MAAEVNAYGGGSHDMQLLGWSGAMLGQSHPVESGIFCHTPDLQLLKNGELLESQDIL